MLPGDVRCSLPRRRASEERLHWAVLLVTDQGYLR